MTETIYPFRLTVTGAENGEYLVGHHTGTEPARVEGLIGIIKEIGKFNSRLLSQEPMYNQVPTLVQDIVNATRFTLVRRDAVLTLNLQHHN